MENKNTNKENEFQKKSREKAREKTIITASAVFVLTALTVTGIYMNNKNNRDKLPKEEVTEFQGNVENIMNTPELTGEGDLQSVDSGTVENPGIVSNKNNTGKNVAASDTSNMLVEGEEETDTQAVLSGEVENMMLSFTGMNMLWPIPVENDVLIAYSMDKAVYFETLDQYKYNPAMIISAEVGTPVCAVSAGKITKRYWDYETGWTYEMDLGGGFKAYYGQLENLQKAEDTYIVAGDVLGYVASPTKYYSKEGSNLYFAMTKDGKPVYPKEYMGE